jgi:hypothetical protein
MVTVNLRSYENKFIPQIAMILLASSFWVSASMNAATADEITYATQAELLDAVIGKSLKGVEQGKEWEEYYKPGKIKKGVAKGKIKGKWGAAKERYSGKWSVEENGLMCFKYPNGEGNGCWYTKIVDGTRVQWYKKNGNRDGEDATIIQ